MAASHSGEPFHIEAVRVDPAQDRHGRDRRCNAARISPTTKPSAQTMMRDGIAADRASTTTARESTPGFSRCARRSGADRRRISKRQSGAAMHPRVCARLSDDDPADVAARHRRLRHPRVRDQPAQGGARVRPLRDAGRDRAGAMRGRLQVGARRDDRASRVRRRHGPVRYGADGSRAAERSLAKAGPKASTVSPLIRERRRLRLQGARRRRPGPRAFDDRGSARLGRYRRGKRDGVGALRPADRV